MPKRIRTIHPRSLTRHMPSIAAKQEDARRGSSAKRGYGSKWRKARITFLAQNPVCVCCEANGHAMATELVDHIEPHGGNLKLFWSRRNWQALCAWCHNNVKQSVERAWKSGRLDASKLNLARKVRGWVHPAER